MPALVVVDHEGRTTTLVREPVAQPDFARAQTIETKAVPSEGTQWVYFSATADARQAIQTAQGSGPQDAANAARARIAERNRHTQSDM
ncbi:hypothetical protein OC861_006731 [Tilletia horrida]|nr:hypothetical protein OC861_006731 [Tilletia horrida]